MMKKKIIPVDTNKRTSKFLIPPTQPVVALIEALDFAPEDVVEAAVKQPSLFLDAADYRVEAMRRRINAESAYEVAKASQAHELRTDAKETGEKITENSISEALLCNTKLQEFSVALSRSQESEEFAKLLLEAFRMRRDAIRVLADLSGQVMSAERAKELGMQEMQAVRERLKERYR